MIIKEVDFTNSRKENIAGIMRMPDDENDYNAVIICHGMNAGKNWHFLTLLADNLARNRFITLNFDFSGYGDSQGEYEGQTVSKMLDDLKSAVDFLEKNKNVKKIFLVGHSLGGSVCLLYAPDDERIKALIIISARIRYEDILKSRFSDYDLKNIQNTGFIVIGGKKINSSFVLDMKKHDFESAAAKIRCPLLVVQGSSDEHIPIQNAREIYQAAKGKKSIEIIDGADHNFTQHSKQLNQDCLVFLTNESNNI